MIKFTRYGTNVPIYLRLQNIDVAYRHSSDTYTTVYLLGNSTPFFIVERIDVNTWGQV